MPRKKARPTWLVNKINYTTEYQRENYRQIKFNFHKIYDADIIQQLDAVENRAGYVKELIRADIAKGDKPMKPIKPINDELKDILQSNNRYAILDTEKDMIDELERLHTSGEIDYKEPEPNEEGKAETVGTARIAVGNKTITAHYKVYLYDWDADDKQYLGSSTEIIGWND